MKFRYTISEKNEQDGSSDALQRPAVDKKYNIIPILSAYRVLRM